MHIGIDFVVRNLLPAAYWLRFRLKMYSFAQPCYEVCLLIVYSNVEDRNPTDKDGNTPLNLASRNGHTEVCQLIKTAIDED